MGSLKCSVLVLFDWLVCAIAARSVGDLFVWLQDNCSKFSKPADYIQYLSTPDLSVNKLYGCIESLRIALTNNPLSWVQEFGTQGLKQVLSILNECYRK